MRGFGSGVVWGGILAVIGLGVVSELTPLPERQGAARIVEPAAVPEAQPEPEPAEPAEVLAPAQPSPSDPLTEDDPEPVPPEPARVPAAQPEPPPTPETEPALPAEPAPPPPETQATPEAEATPEAAPAAAAVEVPAGSEFARALPETDPEAPAAERAPTTAILPGVEPPAASPGQPQTDTATAARPQPVPAEPVLPEVVPGQDTSPAPGAAPGIAAAPAPTAAPRAPGADATPGTADAPPPAPAAEPDPAPEADPLRPTPGFGTGVAGVTTGRLPRIGADAPPAAETAAEPPPIAAYARPFDNPEGKPAFAILLIDAGDPTLDRAALAQLPFPISFALDPTLPGVGDLAAIYRAGGQEVVMLATGIPAGATAADLEVTFQAHAAALPEAVALVDLAEGGFQADRDLSSMVVPVLAGQGRGLMTHDAGLNAADQVARREGLRAATIFRVVDADDAPADAIRRQLDRAAFKAAQDGEVTVVAEARAETIAALMAWTVEGRAAAVALAPVTAVLIAR